LVRLSFLPLSVRLQWKQKAEKGSRTAMTLARGTHMPRYWRSFCRSPAALVRDRTFEQITISYERGISGWGNFLLANAEVHA
jgi:hypothetical protein